MGHKPDISMTMVHKHTYFATSTDIDHQNKTGLCVLHPSPVCCRQTQIAKINEMFRSPLLFYFPRRGKFLDESLVANV